MFLRYRSFVVLLACFTTMHIHAQIALGVRAGVNWSNMVFPDVDDDPPGDINWETSARLTPSVALIADLPFTPRLSVQPELAYVQRGYDYRPGGPAILSVFRAQHLLLDYLDAALLAKFHLGQEPARPHLIAGATYGRMLGARVLYDDLNNPGTPGSVLDANKLGMRLRHFGLCAGGGFTISVGDTWLIVEGRYNYGLTNIWNGVVLADVNGAVIGELNSYDRSWQFNIGWILPMPGHGTDVDPAQAPDSE